MPASDEQFSDVILSGGTGRSGTTIIGKLLSRHSQIGLARPAEIKMLTSGNGLLDLSVGKRVGRYKRLLITDGLHLQRFRYRLFNDWWQRESKFGETAGLIQGIELEKLQALYLGLKSDWKREPRRSLQDFFRAFVDSQKSRSGKPIWIDTTPLNLIRAREITELLPGARFIHMVRDGRDVAASVIREPWGPNSYDDALLWYRNRMMKILSNVRQMDGNVLTISLEDLTITKRDETLDSVLTFLDISSEKTLERYFESEVIPERVRRGRWKDEVANVDRFNSHYFEIVSELKEIDPTLPLES